MASRTRVGFIEPMLLLRTDKLPDDPARWSYQLKLDGYRAIAFKTGGKVHLRSRNDNDFNARYSKVVRGLAKLPNETVIDGELIALADDGSPSFNALQNYGSASTPILYFVFDVLVLEGRDLTGETFDRRREILERKIVPTLAEPVRYAGALDASLRDLVHSVKAQGLEGLVAKRRDSRYEPGLRSGAWMKMRINQGQEFVIGGYTFGTKTFDALIFGYYDGTRLIYAARTRNGFTRAVRAQLFKKFQPLKIAECPFANLPEAKSGRWGQGLTKGEDGRVPMAQARTRWTVRVPGMDWRQPSTAHQIHQSARRQECPRRQAGIRALTRSENPAARGTGRSSCSRLRLASRLRLRERV